MHDERFEGELRALVHRLAPASAPPQLGRRIATALDEADRTRTSRPRWNFTTVAAVGLMLVVAALATRFGPGLLEQRGQGSGSRPTAPSVDLATAYAVLEANSLEITAGHRRFGPPSGNVEVHSDPGGTTYRTLEAVWSAGGTEMRLFIYFAADERQWWVSEIRTYDGLEPGDWITYPGPLFKTEKGKAYAGDVHLTSQTGRVGGSLIITGMRLSAFAPDQPSGRTTQCPAGPITRGTDATDPTADGGPLAGRGLAEMSPDQVRSVVMAAGYCVGWRYEYRTDEANRRFGELWCVPPTGRVTSAAYGREGEVVVFVTPYGNPVMTPRPQPRPEAGCT